ncbi:MAG: MaoC family dehydratase [Alphaproteobacteria bacterium]
MAKYFENIRIGEQTTLGDYTFTDDEIIRYAKKFDPQEFHIDVATAQKSFYQGLIASGWHTATIWMKMWVAYNQRQLETAQTVPGERLPRMGPSTGLKDLSWPSPVRAGDTVSYHTRVTEKTSLRSRPQWGLVTSRNTGLNQNGVLVLSFTGQVFVERHVVAANR